MTVAERASERFHPHPAFGHLLSEGDGIEPGALGQAVSATLGSLSQRERDGERENANIWHKTND